MFITGRSAWRTGRSKVGVPGVPVGLQARDITIAQALKPLGYATGQYGKNHLGDRDEYLPTNHGFDEFYGNLYHLNAEEEPERPYWPGDNPGFLKTYNPKAVIHSFADGKIEDTGPLTVKRMETIDDETTKACSDFITKQAKAGTPSFAWMNFTRMHIFTHVRPEYEGKAGLGKGYFYADGTWELDQNVGKLRAAAGTGNRSHAASTSPNQVAISTAPDCDLRPSCDCGVAGLGRAAVGCPSHRFGSGIQRTASEFGGSLLASLPAGVQSK
jgi:arylsulfatase A-like enzyme